MLVGDGSGEAHPALDAGCGADAGVHDEALAAWRRKAQETVDNALMRYFIIHAHKLLDPEKDPQKD